MVSKRGDALVQHTNLVTSKQAVKTGCQTVSTHPPTPIVRSVEYGALSDSIAVTSFFFESFYYSPDEADNVFPFQVFLGGRARSERTRKQK